MENLVMPVITHDTVVNGPPQGQWTRDDWEKLPDDGNRYEVIDGVLYMSTAPKNFHQYCSRRFYDLVGYPANQAGIAIVEYAPIGVFMPGCEPVQPDLVVVLKSKASIFRDGHIYGVPDLLVEVLSPSTKRFDEGVKRNAYEHCGVPEYVVIDPAARQLRLYTLNTSGQYGQPVTYNAQDTVSFACLPTISFRVGDLFDGAQDTTL